MGGLGPGDRRCAISRQSYNGLVTVVTNAAGNTKTQTRNPLGELLQIEDHLGSVLRYEYNQRGELHRIVKVPSIADAAASNILMPQTVVEFVFDALGRKVKMTDPDKGIWQYRYNAFGELLWQKDGNGQVVKNRYDGDGRLLNRTDYQADGTVENYTRWYYDGQTESSTNKLDQAIGQVSAVIMRGTDQGATVCSLAAGAKECSYNSYDGFGRSEVTRTRLFAGGRDQGQYESSVEYDSQGRVHRQYDALHGLVKSTASG